MNGPDGKWIGYAVGDRGEPVQAAKRVIRRKFFYGKQLDDETLFGEDFKVALVTYQVNKNVERVAQAKVPLRIDGVLDYATRDSLGLIPHVAAPPRFPIQGVGGDSRAYLMPPDAPSFQKDVQAFGQEGHRLHSILRANGPAPIVPIGYSMGGTSVKRFLDTVPAEWRDDIKMVITFGDPSMPAEGSLLGNMPGEGIAKEPQPQWCWDRYYSFAIDGDWYPQARGLLFILYQVISRAELTLDFASWLFTQFPTMAMQQLLGQAPSTDPLAGVLSGMAGMITTGPANVIGSLLGPVQILGLLPQLVQLLTDAIKFAATGAHGQYGNHDYALWDGMCAVDKAAALIREKVPTATLLLFPGSWAQWNEGFPFDVAMELR
ncbi:hypothetical protein E3G52_000384 [Mycobacteroides abscessus]|uniref:cutinase n=1 Tax=Mycobacteroides abscessus TaxID=36809 RepID=UPI001877B618|nr:cutinase [Mycobacteroides abscessus]MBE5453520.1 hypothetical protein [Mycobacteroides abscessus]